MHIDHDSLDLRTESDVEQKLIMPLLTGSPYLAIPQDRIFTKNYLAPTIRDKSAVKTSGFPDYSLWMHGFPVLIVEAKAADVAAEIRYREASLFARHLNQQYPSDFNPCRCIVSTNGETLLFGHWDSSPKLTIAVRNLRVGTSELLNLGEYIHNTALQGFALSCLARARATRSFHAYNGAGGQALLNA